MGVLRKLFGKKKVVGKQAVTKEEAEGATAPGTKSAAAKTSRKAARKTTRKAAPAKAARKTTRKAAKKTAKKAAKTSGKKAAKKTAKKAAKTSGKKAAKKTAKKAAKKTSASRKAAKTATGAPTRGQVTHGDYKLFQKGNRYFFSKKASKDVDGTPVTSMPAGRSVVTTPNGMPVLKKN